MLLSLSPRNLSNEKDRLGQSENDYVEKSVRFALQLVNDDLRTNAHKFTAKCSTLDALKRILDYKELFYVDSPFEVRMDKILVFQRIKGFYHLAIYLNARANTTSFPEDWELVHRALTASYEGIVNQRLDGNNTEVLNKFCKEASNMSVGAMKHLKSMKKETLEMQDVHKLSTIIKDLKQLHFQLAVSDPKSPLNYIEFCKNMIVLLLPAHSLEHKMYGQEMLHELIETVHNFGPVIGAYNVIGAGCGFINGMYSIAPSKRDSGGHAIPGVDVSYERVDQTTGKKFVLFLDTTFEEGDATWCLSEEHDDEMMRELDYTDYYTVVPDGPQKYPPLQGWEESEGSKGPCPTLQPLPKMIPIREEHKALKENLSKWLLEKKIADLIVGADIGAANDDGTISKLMEALDRHMKDRTYVSAKMASLFVAILPSIQQNAPNSSPRGFSQSSTSIAALDAARQRLASAERWEQNTSRALKTAQSEHQAATSEVDEARAYLDRLDQQCSYFRDERELSLSDVNGDHPDSIGSSITSVTEDNHQPASFNLPSRRVARTLRGVSKNRRGSIS